MSTFLLLGFGLLPGVLAQETPGSRAPLEARESMAQLYLAPGFRVELVASEPRVLDPIDIAFDAAERLWVVEMGDYPIGPQPGEEPRGRIRVLEDTDGDGDYESSRLHATGLIFPTGILPYRDGVFVTTRDALLYLGDADGDGKADRRQVLFDGFSQQNSQLLPNNPTWGPDGWIWVANGLRADDLRIPASGSEIRLSIRGHDFRFHPESRAVETASGVSQFGMAFNDDGDRFTASNRNHIRHVVIPARYLERHPHLAVADVVEDIPDHGAAARLYPLSRNWTTSNLHTGTFTAACGLHIYRGHLLASLRGDSLTCDPTGNLVHRDRLRSTGSTYVASRIEKESEFLASPDEWFRPVNLATGPEGALYVVDMYRAVIEHPQFMPPELKNRPDLYDGRDRGRIYRVVPATRTGDVERPGKLAGASTAVLVKALEHPNAWRRETAQRLLVERDAGDAVPLLKKGLRGAAAPLATLHALWTLDGLGALGTSSLESALASPHPAVRRAALRLAEPRLDASARLRTAVLERAGDADRRVLFQFLLGAGFLASAETLADLARRERGDPWFRRALLIAAAERPLAVTRRLLDGGNDAPSPEFDPDLARLLRDLAALVASQHVPRSGLPGPDSLLRHLGGLRGSAAGRWRIVGVLGLLDGARRRGKRLATLLEGKEGDWHRTPTPAAQLEAILRDAARSAVDGTRPRAERIEAVEVLAAAPGDVAFPVLTRLLDGTGDPELRLAAVRSLRAHPREDVPALLLERWRGLTPPLRRAAADALLSRRAWVPKLLDAIEAGDVLANDLDTTRRRRLSAHADVEIRRRARKLLVSPSQEDRARVIERYRAALEMPADRARGRRLFQENCSSCHRVAGMGTDVAPDISDTRTRTPEALLVDILDPNRAIDTSYVSYLLTTRNGRSLIGVIASETAAAVTLKWQDGESETVLRQEIQVLSSSGVSLMPEGLEEKLDLQQMADLIRFLKDWRYEE